MKKKIQHMIIYYLWERFLWVVLEQFLLEFIWFILIMENAILD